MTSRNSLRPVVVIIVPQLPIADLAEEHHLVLLLTSCFTRYAYIHHRTTSIVAQITVRDAPDDYSTERHRIRPHTTCYNIMCLFRLCYLLPPLQRATEAQAAVSPSRARNEFRPPPPYVHLRLGSLCSAGRDSLLCRSVRNYSDMYC